MIYDITAGMQQKVTKINRSCSNPNVSKTIYGKSATMSSHFRHYKI